MSKRLLSGLLAVGALAQVPDPSVGKKIFESQCALCHGQTGTGGRGPSLNRPKLGRAPDDEALWKVISNGIEPEMPGAWQLNPREVYSVAAYVRSLGTMPPEKLPGDSLRGERVFASKGCGGCHVVAGKGDGYGPELTDIGTRRNGVHLRQAILKPATLLPEGFLYVAATTQNGATVRGIRVNEDSFNIQIKDARGQFHSFAKSELKELRRLRDETPMPSFEGSLSAADLDDLVAYLASLKGKS
ncbi:MAG TPA: c-type cytochrome [Bryobacteraceae bacterium]|jgi:cytochrome c oxidase cbb3-type subunit 3|nr:c-type cytochrome [Bryobacteraceae bacterium]